jgi:methionyl-tRNA formyltransferase
MEHNLPLLQPTNLKDGAFLKALRELRADVQVVVAFRMLPRAVWEMPPLGTFNLHASLLPHYRGAAPINWAIINGEIKTGATTFFLDDKIDTGEIILQVETPISLEDTAGSLHDRLMPLGAALVRETLEKIALGTVATRVQAESGTLKMAPKINRDTCEVDWARPLKSIYDHIRGLSPYPGAWTTLYNGAGPLLLKLYAATMEPKEHDFPVGQLIVDKKGIQVAVKGGTIHLMEVQLPGKRKMPVRDILNGVKFMETAYVR